ncbi:MAG TPA: nuclear transport factor 2 family protein [Cytophagales bacterium]|nr:nuclear transport factor 2 family protein [Cytophagales bacterium]
MNIKYLITRLSVLTFSILLIACTVTKTHKPDLAYVPESQEVHDRIVFMDSLWGEAYNSCKEAVLDSIISDDLEFYHDRGGVNTSKASLMDIYRRNVCGKVTRELLPGSIEVYPIANYGAVEMGRHRFYSNETEKNGQHRYSKFVHIWHHKDGRWQITRVVSLH